MLISERFVPSLAPRAVMFCKMLWALWEATPVPLRCSQRENQTTCVCVARRPRTLCKVAVRGSGRERIGPGMHLMFDCHHERSHGTAMCMLSATMGPRGHSGSENMQHYRVAMAVSERLLAQAWTAARTTCAMIVDGGRTALCPVVRDARIPWERLPSVDVPTEGFFDNGC